MRTVTFSNESVAKAVNASFVCTWINRNPKFHNCELSTEQRIVGDSYEAYATRNFCTFFATPEKDLLHYMSGYYDPEFFLAELDFVKKLAGAVTAPSATFDRAKLPVFAKLHRDRDDYYAAKLKELAKAKIDSGRKDSTPKWGTTGSRKGNLMEALTHLKDVNHWFWNEGQSKRVTALDYALKNHLAGNSFTEE
jgi:hypothetical protein